MTVMANMVESSWGWVVKAMEFQMS